MKGAKCCKTWAAQNYLFLGHPRLYKWKKNKKLTQNISMMVKISSEYIKQAQICAEGCEGEHFTQIL